MVMDAALLHLDPNSPEAQFFYQLGSNFNQSAGSPAPDICGYAWCLCKVVPLPNE